jgi:predicted dithiol-disulfide oxidoreductase (DUF899 family)
MYGKNQTRPCPMCTMMIDGFNGIASHGPALSHESSMLADDMRERGEDLTIAVYNLLDLTPAGRGDFYACLDYGVDVHWGAYLPRS